MNIAVLGANGFVGRSVCLKFVNEGHEVFAIYNRDKSLIPAQCSKYSILELPRSKVDCLFIAVGGHGLSHKQYLEEYVIIDRVLKYLMPLKVIFISSVAVYGKSTTIIKFDSCYNQPCLYGLSKLNQEFLVKSTEDFVIIRPTYLYGNGMNENSIIPIWKNSALRNKEIIVFGDGSRVQDYLHIEDLVDLCFLAVVNNVKGDFIAASGRSISNLDLAKEITKSISEASIGFVGEDDSASFQFDISRTSDVYNWHPKISLEQGLTHYFKNENSNL